MTLGVLLALVTSVSWALGNVFIQKSGVVLGAARAMLWAMAGGGLAAGVCSLAFDRRVAPFSSEVMLWTATAGIFGVIAYSCLFFAFAKARLSVTVPIISSWSLISAILSLTVFGEEVRAGQIPGAVCVFAGAVLVSVSGVRTGGEVKGGERRPREKVGMALWAALGSGVGFGVMVPALGRVAPAAGEFGAAALVYGVGLALGLPLALVARVDVRPPPRQAWPLVAMTGVLETAGYVAVTLARRYAPMALVAPVASLAALITVLYAWLVLRERPPRLARLGALLASAGVVILAR